MDERSEAGLDVAREDLIGGTSTPSEVTELAHHDPAATPDLDLERPEAPDPEVVRRPTISLADAARLYGLSESTLRRRLTSGALPGSRKLPGSRGEEWHLPVDELEALGYRRGGVAADGAVAGAEPASPASGGATSAELRARRPVDAGERAARSASQGSQGPSAAVDRLTEALVTADRRLRAAEDEREHADLERQEAVLRAARAEAVLEVERRAAETAAERLRVLEERLDRVTAERDRYAQALTWSGRRRLRRESRSEELQADERDRFRRAYTRDT